MDYISQVLLPPVLPFSLHSFFPASHNPTDTSVVYRLNFCAVSCSPHPFHLRWANCSAMVLQQLSPTRSILQQIKNTSHNNRAKTLQKPCYFPPAINILFQFSFPWFPGLIFMGCLLFTRLSLFGTPAFARSTVELRVMDFKKNLASLFRWGLHFISSSSPPPATCWHALSHNSALQRSSNYYVIPRLVFRHQYENMTGGCQLNNQ